MHGLAHFSLAYRIRCTFILCVCVCSLRNTSEPRVISFSSCDAIARALRCVCGTRIRMCVCVSAALSRCSAGSSPSPGCNSNWLNLPGKLRGWLEAPSNYLTVAKPAVKNRFSCSFILPFGNKVQICCQERTTAHHFWGCVTSVIWCSLQYTEYQKWMYAPPGTKTADYIHAPLLTGAASVFESYNWPQLAGQGHNLNYCYERSYQTVHTDNVLSGKETQNGKILETLWTVFRELKNVRNVWTD